MRVDNRRDGIGSVVESVDKFESQRRQQRDAQQHERKDRGRVNCAEIFRRAKTV